MRGLHATAVHHIPALSPVQTPFPKLAEPETTQSIKDKSRERRESKGGHTGRALLALTLYEPWSVVAAAKQGVHQKLCGRGVVELRRGLERHQHPTDNSAHAARGGLNILPSGRPGQHTQVPGQQPKSWPHPRCARYFCQGRPRSGPGPQWPRL
jgi:hypothetical protein